MRLKLFRVGGTPPGGKGSGGALLGLSGSESGLGSGTKHCEADRRSGLRAGELAGECGFRDGGVLSC